MICVPRLHLMYQEAPVRTSAPISIITPSPCTSKPIPFSLIPMTPTTTQDPEKGNSEADAKEKQGWLDKFMSDHPRYFRAVHLIPAIILLVWPYIFSAVIWERKSQGGLQASDRIAKLVREDLRSVNFFVTAIVVVISAMMTYLFTTGLLCVYRDKVKKVVVRHSGEKGGEGEKGEKKEDKKTAVKENDGEAKKSLRAYWDKLKTVAKKEMEKAAEQAESPFISFYRAMKASPEDWPVGKMFSAIFLKKNHRKAFSLVVLLGLCSATFTFISPGLNAILLPQPFSRLRPLQGYELDFSSTDTTCVEWVVGHPIPPTCNWREHNGFEFTDCLGENQLVDVLEAGRSNMRYLMAENDTLNTLTFTQLGGVSFLGPIHGVFPIGPNGVPAFDTLQALPPHVFQSASSYDYTVELQGVSSDVHCQYDSSTPISTIPITGESVALFNASCPTGVTIPDFGPYPVPHISAISNNTLGAWPCKSSSLGNSYVIYLNGSGNYANVVGNMSCTISLLQPSLYNVTYNSSSNLFVAQNTSATSSNTTISVYDRSVSGVLNSIIEAQNLDTNLVVESVITYAVKYLKIGLDPSQIYIQDPRYLQLFQALIQGMVEYEAAYTRMIFLSLSPPPSCNRTVSGMISYEVIGWGASAQTAAYLLPLTLISIASIGMLMISIIKNEEGTGESLQEWKDRFKEGLAGPLRHQIVNAAEGAAEEAAASHVGLTS